jgi:hypothetical protein
MERCQRSRGFHLNDERGNERDNQHTKVPRVWWIVRGKMGALVQNLWESHCEGKRAFAFVDFSRLRHRGKVGKYRQVILRTMLCLLIPPSSIFNLV